MRSEIYRFFIDFTDPLITTEWLYVTPNRKAVTYDTKTWNPLAITRDDFNYNTENSVIKMVAPMDAQPFPKWRFISPHRPVKCEILLYPSGTRVFKGIVNNVEFRKDDGEVDVELEYVKGYYKGKVPRFNFGPSCQWDLFDAGCTLDKNSFKTTFGAAAAVISEDTVQHANIASEADGYWIGGYVEVLGQYSMVIDHVGDTVTLLTPLYDVNLDPSVNIIVYAGCDKLVETCRTKFSNENNFKGNPWVPTNNIFVTGW